MSLRFIVTGGAGFVGSNIVKKLLDKFPNPEVIVVDNFQGGHFHNLIGVDCNLHDADIRSFNWDQFGGTVSAVFHQAAITDTNVHDQKEMISVNATATKNAIDYSLKFGVPLIYASSSAVYGQHPESAMVPGVNENPLNVYAYSKLLADTYTRRAIFDAKKTNKRIRIFGLRYFNVYGPGEQDKNGKTMSMVHQLYQQLKLTGSCKLFKNGEQQRDYVHIEDIVDANILAYKSTMPGIYNVGQGDPISFNEMAEIIAQNLNVPEYKVEFFENKNPKFYQNYTHANLVDSFENIGYQPKHTYDSGIGSYIYYLENA